MKKAIRFRVEGVLNSFRIPVFKKYHKTFLAPPKTVILGMVSNIMGESEEFYYNLLNSDIYVSVVIKNIEGKAKDLWRYRDKGNSIIRRDKLFKSEYMIFIHSQDLELLDKIETSLKFPKAIPSLGLDDELINILDVESVELSKNETSEIDSIFMQNEDKFFITLNPKTNMVVNSGEVPLVFEVEFDKNGKRLNRKALKTTNQMEYLGCKIEVDGESWSDGQDRIKLY